MDHRAVIEWASANGWSYSQASLYDEEGVEGYLWTGPQGEELTSHAIDGDWKKGPEAPDELVKRYSEKEQA